MPEAVGQYLQDSEEAQPITLCSAKSQVSAKRRVEPRLAPSTSFLRPVLENDSQQKGRNAGAGEAGLWHR